MPPMLGFSHYKFPFSEAYPFPTELGVTLLETLQKLSFCHGLPWDVPSIGTSPLDAHDHILCTQLSELQVRLSLIPSWFCDLTGDFRLEGVFGDSRLKYSIPLLLYLTASS